MKHLWIILVIALVVDSGSRLMSPSTANAQATGVFVSPQVVSAQSACTWPVGASVTNGVAWCFVNTGLPTTSGMFFSLNGSTTWTALVPPASAAAVTSIAVGSGTPRTGAVVLTKTDITGLGLVASASPVQ